MSNPSVIEQHRPLFNRVIKLRPMIRPKTGDHFDALAAPDAAADRLLKAAVKRKTEKVAEWKATVQTNANRLEDAQAALKRLKQRRKAGRSAGLTQTEKAIQTMESQVALLKECRSVEKKELISMVKGTAAWLIDAREVASTEADAVRNWRSSRLRFIMRELEQDYESYGGFANIKSSPRRDMAEMVLLITALIVDPDAEAWVPRLTDWQDLPWVRIDGERKDGLYWNEMEPQRIHLTRCQLMELIFPNGNAETWVALVKNAMKVLKATGLHWTTVRKLDIRTALRLSQREFQTWMRNHAAAIDGPKTSHSVRVNLAAIPAGDAERIEEFLGARSK